jgi:hypothetical protein
MSQSRNERRKQEREQKKTNSIFNQNIKYHGNGDSKFGVFAIVETDDIITPTRFMMPKTNLVKSQFSLDEIQSNIGAYYYAIHNYEQTYPHHKMSKEDLHNNLVYAYAAFASNLYYSSPEMIRMFQSENFGMIISFKFNDLGNGDYEIAQTTDQVVIEFDKWLEDTDNIKLDLASTMDKGEKLSTNKILY